MPYGVKTFVSRCSASLTTASSTTAVATGGRGGSASAGATGAGAGGVSVRVEVIGRGRTGDAAARGGGGARHPYVGGRRGDSEERSVGRESRQPRMKPLTDGPIATSCDRAAP